VVGVPFRQVWDRALTFEVIIAGTVAFIVLTLTVFALIRYRSRARERASQHTEHKAMEFGYAFLLLLIAIAIVIVTRSFNSDDGLAPTAQTAASSHGGLHIRVTGFQWCWRFQYAGPGSTDFSSLYAVVQKNCLHGPSDVPTMVVPVGETVTVETTSQDVIHSWWVPDLRYKLDAFPNHVNTVTLRLTRTGRWIGHCAEFCGLRHAEMSFWLKAVTQEQFRSWLSAQHDRQPTAGAA
jgi:cytochrome c oxidase subunit 2